MSRMVSSPTPLSARSVINVCRLSCHLPFTFALLRTLFHEVLSVTIGRVGSLGRGFPKGKTYQSGRIVPNRFSYHCKYSIMLSKRIELNGIVRPSPASVLLSPTVNMACDKFTRPHWRPRI